MSIYSQSRTDGAPGLVTLVAQPLTPEGFAPFGSVLSRLDAPGRVSPAADLQNLRHEARPVLGVLRIAAAAAPLRVLQIERHAFSTQTFVALGDQRFVVVVAPAGAVPPAPADFRAFVAAEGEGVTYRPGVWHHPLFAWGGPADFATLIWKADDGHDEQFTDLPVGLEIVVTV